MDWEQNVTFGNQTFKTSEDNSKEHLYDPEKEKDILHKVKKKRRNKKGKIDEFGNIKNVSLLTDIMK